jgi:c-di-GMP-binding flagellar brake protein YcgR
MCPNRLQRYSRTVKQQNVLAEHLMTTNTDSSLLATAVHASERRRFTRYDIDVTLRVTVHSSGLVKTVHGRGNNVSRGGLAAHIAIELAIGDSVELEITLPYSSQLLTIPARVQNRESYCYGMQFLNPPVSAQNEIERCCQALMLTQ